MKIHQEWHHACLTIKTTQKTYNTMQSDTKLYYDGELVNKGIQKIYGTVQVHDLILLPKQSLISVFFIVI